MNNKHGIIERISDWTDSNAAEWVFLLLSIGVVVGFLTNRLDPKDFVMISLIAFQAFFGKKKDEMANGHEKHLIEEIKQPDIDEKIK